MDEFTQELSKWIDGQKMPFSIDERVSILRKAYQDVKKYTDEIRTKDTWLLWRLQMNVLRDLKNRGSTSLTFAQALLKWALREGYLKKMREVSTHNSSWTIIRPNYVRLDIDE